MVAGLMACTSLAVPNYSTEISALRTGAYQLDPKHAALLFRVSHLGLSTYVGRFNTVQAVLDFDAAHPEQALLEAVIEMNSLDVNNTSFAQTLTGPSWLDANTYPQARFISREIEITSGKTGLAKGELTLKGVTMPLTLAVTFNGGANNMISQRYTLGFTGKTTINRANFGIQKYPGLVGEVVEIEFQGEFQRTGQPRK